MSQKEQINSETAKISAIQSHSDGIQPLLTYIRSTNEITDPVVKNEARWLVMMKLEAILESVVGRGGWCGIAYSSNNQKNAVRTILDLISPQVKNDMIKAHTKNPKHFEKCFLLFGNSLRAKSGGKKKKSTAKKKKTSGKKKKTAGKKKKTCVKVVAGKKRVIHTGAKGGKYFISKGAKRYI